MTDPAPSVIEGMLAQGFEAIEKGAFEGAIETFTACLAVAPQEPNAYRGRATAFFELHQWREAQADFLQAKELNPIDPENWIGYGMSLAMDYKIYEGLQVVETILERYPTYLRTHMTLGFLHLKIGAIRKGREYLEKALTLQPSLQERRLIQAQLQEQDKLDRRRYYRPDFEALRQKKAKF